MGDSRPIQCPVCYSELEIRDCTPCDLCGGNPEEVEHLYNKLHVYCIYEFKGSKLTLCNFCSVDLNSYKPEYFGLNAGEEISYRRLNFLKEIGNPKTVRDKFCSECQKRLSLLHFINENSSKNSTG